MGLERAPRVWWRRIGLGRREGALAHVARGDGDRGGVGGGHGGIRACQGDGRAVVCGGQRAEGGHAHLDSLLRQAFAWSDDIETCPEALYPELVGNSIEAGLLHREQNDMLENLKLEMYRGFRAYELGDLSRVNLLVGKNNCGKTSILEAIHFLVSGGDPSVLTQAAYQRGEVNFPYGSGPRHGREEGSDISHFFFGHRIESGACLRLSANSGYGPIDAQIVLAGISEDIDSPYWEDKSLLSMEDESLLSMDDNTFQDLALQIRVGNDSAKHLPPLPVSANGSLFIRKRAF